MEKFEEAIKYFHKAIDAGEKSASHFIALIARAHAALTYLAHGKSDCIGKAQEVMYTQENLSGDFASRCMAAMAKACISLRQEKLLV